MLSDGLGRLVFRKAALEGAFHKGFYVFAEVLAQHPLQIPRIFSCDLTQALFLGILAEHHVELPVPPAELAVRIVEFLTLNVVKPTQE